MVNIIVKLTNDMTLAVLSLLSLLLYVRTYVRTTETDENGSDYFRRAKSKIFGSQSCKSWIFENFDEIVDGEIKPGVAFTLKSQHCVGTQPNLRKKLIV